MTWMSTEFYRRELMRAFLIRYAGDFDMDMSDSDLQKKFIEIWIATGPERAKTKHAADISAISYK